MSMFRVRIHEPSPWNLVSNPYRTGLFRTVADIRAPNHWWVIVEDGFDFEATPTYDRFPMLVELHDWHVDSFGADGDKWLSHYFFGEYRLPTSVIPGVYDIFCQYHYSDISQLALFKLRWM